MIINSQLRLDDVNPEYKAFLDKFDKSNGHKMTTDDCYTPAPVYEAVLNWCVERYGIRREDVVRPFYPGGDYERENYQDGAVVVDNPPFSILADILRTYLQAGIRFFLFAPYLSNFSTGTDKVAHVIAPCQIVYHNGAVVNTSYLTNMEPDDVVAIAAPDLSLAVKKANKASQGKEQDVKHNPVLTYPSEVLTASMLGRLAEHGVAYTLRKSESAFIRALDEQRDQGTAIFGGGSYCLHRPQNARLRHRRRRM